MQERLTGYNVDVYLPTGIISTWDKVEVDASGGVKEITRNGRPDGYVFEEVTGSVKITLCEDELSRLIDEAKKHGSWMQLPALDVTFNAEFGSRSFKAEVFGIKFKLFGFSFEKKGGDETKFELEAAITGSDFIKLNGLPLLKP